jgi:predicted DCC family thiol-disulfide oxidoreductase YuxK
MKYYHHINQEADPPIILYDGYCNLCSRIVQFIFNRDKSKRFNYYPVQSENGDNIRKLLIMDEHNPQSVILITSDNIYTNSDAVLEILIKLGFPMNMLWILFVIPRFIRDPIYSFIAKNRFRWFGKRNNCYLPGRK